MIAPWVPSPGVMVKDLLSGRIGKAVGWEPDTREVILAPLDGGEPWETDTFRPPNELDRLRARVAGRRRRA
ncbi:hypothetical protein SSP35_23_00040 [Streptomyces sp. NBRC 110611]|nr:hypothetical protein SSP35_23_00040 [Streptomyces sp. NBRC 110611]